MPIHTFMLLPAVMAEFLFRFSFLIILWAIMMIAVCLATNVPGTTLRGEGCSDEHTYTYVNSTAFHENLDAVFTTLNSDLSSDGFATSIQNKSSKTDPVYGLAVCRKYLTSGECSECIRVAETEVKKICPRSNGGRVHLDGCSVRYENSSFYDQSVDGGMTSNCSSTNNGDPQTFSEIVEDLSKQLIANVSANKGYAFPEKSWLSNVLGASSDSVTQMSSNG